MSPNRSSHNSCIRRLDQFAVATGSEPTAEPHAESPPQQATSTETAAQDHPDAHHDDHPGASDAFDLETALQRVPGGIDAVKQLAPLLLTECDRQLIAIREALAQQNADVVQRGRIRSKARPTYLPPTGSSLLPCGWS